MTATFARLQTQGRFTLPFKLRCAGMTLLLFGKSLFIKASNEQNPYRISQNVHKNINKLLGELLFTSCNDLSILRDQRIY